MNVSTLNGRELVAHCPHCPLIAIVGEHAFVGDDVYDLPLLLPRVQLMEPRVVLGSVGPFASPAEEDPVAPVKVVSRSGSGLGCQPGTENRPMWWDKRSRIVLVSSFHVLLAPPCSRTLAGRGWVPWTLVEW